MNNINDVTKTTGVSSMNDSLQNNSLIFNGAKKYGSDE
jgi:hypothetical protein